MKKVCLRLLPASLLSTLILALGLGLNGCNTEDPLPNILIILVDDMGYGDLGCYNSGSRIPTPAIDGLANEGMRFTDAHASGPLCHPSRYGLITGTYPFRTDVSVWRTRSTIDKGMLTLPGLLADRTYHTAMVGKWHLGFNEQGYDQPLKGGPIDRGFEEFFGIRASTDIPPYFYIRNDRAVAPPTEHTEASSTEGWSPIQGAFWREGGIAPELALKDVLPTFTREAKHIIRKHAGDPEEKRPLMLYLAFPAPHTPWLPDSASTGKSKAGLYGDFVHMVDRQVAEVLNALKEEGMEENTLIIFSSDNGPVWYAQDEERFGHDASGGLRGMKGDAWEAGHRMPFIIKWPGVVDKGSFSHHTLCFTDVLATLAEATGAQLPEGAGMDSYSFYPILTGALSDKELSRPPIVMESANGSMMIRSGKWKLIDHLGSGGFSKPGRREAKEGEAPGQLYDLELDPGETNNLYSLHPEQVKSLTREMNQILFP